jgi:LmbE family N-acetylglucosaminyl deacetylase
VYIRPEPAEAPRYARIGPLTSAHARSGYRAGVLIDPGTDVERVLVVTAHPDDVDFGVGGTIALWTQAGVEVAYCIVTNGDAGGFDPAVPRSEIASIRQAEQRAAAKVLGVENVTYLGYPDGQLTVTLELRRDISRVIRQFRPERVVAQSPSRNWQRVYASHPDHMATGEATMCAVYPDSRNPFAHPELLNDEGLEPWSVAETWIAQGPDSDYYVDITDHIATKVKALQAHTSQTSHLDDLEERLRMWAGANALAAGAAEGRLAEAFRVVNSA